LRYESEIVDGEPGAGAKPLDWELVRAESRKDIPADGTYTLTWISLRQPGKRLTTRITLRNPANPAFPPG
jgi:hypothetical protein